MEINFSQMFDKLVDPNLFPEYNKYYGPFTFCTFRGLTYLTKFKANQLVDVLVNFRHIFFAKVVRVDKVRICDIGIDILRKDTMLSGKSRVNSHRDFIIVLNSLRKYNKIESINEELCRIILQKIELGDLKKWVKEC